VEDKVMRLYEADDASASASACLLKGRCEGGLFLHTRCAGGWETSLVTASMHLQMEAEECKLAIVSAAAAAAAAARLRGWWCGSYG
jgi:hypothetical protein